MMHEFKYFEFFVCRYMELTSYADKIEKACFEVIREGDKLTGDLGGKGKCSEFTDAICKKVESG